MLVKTEIMLGSEEDKSQEGIQEDVSQLTLNQEQATILYLATLRSEQDTMDALKLFKEQRNLKPEDRMEALLEHEVLNENIRLANYTLGKLRYLIGELKGIIEELDKPEETSGIIKRPEWR